MPLADIANVSIVVSARGPSQQGFGEPLIAGLAPWQALPVAEYSALTDLTTAGCPVTSPVYLEAQSILSQSPAPPFFKVGRRTPANTYTQVLTLTCTSTSTSDVYSFSLRTPGGTWVPFSLQSTGVPATDATTLATAITTNIALTTSPLHGYGTTASPSSAVITLTSAAGKLIDVLFDSHNMTFADTTTLAGSGLTADLATIQAYDSNFFALCLDSNSPAEVTQAFAYCEANGLLGGFNCSDTAIGNGGSTTDIAYTTHTSAYAQSFGIFAGTSLLCYSAAAELGVNLPSQPGSENWAFKTLAGVPADNLSTSQIHAIEAKGWNVYTPIAGLNLTQFGTTPGGSFIDIPRSIAWLKNLIQTNILALLANNNKVPFTDAGRDMIMFVVNAALQQGVAVGMLAANPAPTVSAPLIANVSQTNKATRNFPGVSFAAKLAGAINSVTLTGTVTS